MTDLIAFLVFWMKNHPIPIGIVFVTFVVLTWALNRKSRLDRDAERIVKNLVESSKDKYRDTRPLR